MTIWSTSCRRATPCRSPRINGATLSGTKADSDFLVAELRELSRSLEEVYTSQASRQDKLQKKAELIEAFRKRLAGEPFRSPDFQKVSTIPINNAYLSLYALYTDDIPLLHLFYQERCGSDLGVFMAAIAKLARAGDVKKLIRAELSGARVRLSP